MTMEGSLRTYLWFITAELSVQTDGKLDITAAYNVLNLELGELGIEAKLLHYPRVLVRC
jgi:hypothetical protein